MVFFFVVHRIGAIPVGIAVARQRLQEHAQQQQHQTKDINRFGNIGLTTDLGEFFFSSPSLVLFSIWFFCLMTNNN